ncbi:MAG: hypothetical protein V1789_06605 [PVC group bacterium]
MADTRDIPIKKLEEIFKGVSCHRRIRIIKLLFPDREINVGEIAGRIKLSIRSTSKHLIQLEKVGFLTSRQSGFFRIYRINPASDDIVNKVILLVVNNPAQNEK